MGGDVTGSSSASTAAVSAGEAALAEPQYITAKTSVWWDIENCQVPRNCDAHAIAQNISSALSKLNYCGPVSISAYGDTNRIPGTVQHALSSTGIALNHVPAGVKDASDKKILVDMLFWAVDNPAPANYLLISGDRDFSNALHQLRMRRYNILLAQPQKASVPLVAAAKSVWRWTSLSAGGPPLSKNETSRLSNGPNNSNSEISPNPVSEPGHVSQPMASSSTTGKVGDGKQKGKYGRKNSYQYQPNISSASSVPPFMMFQEMTSTDHSYQTESKQFKKAPHEFFGSSAADHNVSASRPNPSFRPGNPDHLGNNGNNFVYFQSSISEQPNNFPMPRFPHENYAPPSTHNHGFRPLPPNSTGPRFPQGPFANAPDVSKLSLSERPSYAQSNPGFRPQAGQEFKTSFVDSFNPTSANIPQRGHYVHSGQPFHHDTLHNRHSHDSETSTPPSTSTASVPVSNGTWGTQGIPPPSEYVQGLIGVILLALNTLKIEKLMPTEANITDCIRYGDPKHRDTDVKKALKSALEQRMIVKQYVGKIKLYVGKNDKLWKCVNLVGGNPNQFPKEMWDKIQKFLTCSPGRSAVMASQCRYEAALSFRKTCLQELSLGDVLQILNMVVATKKWIVPDSSGWQPITIALAENESEVGAETAA